jgi:hypothetical protein
VVVEGGYPVLRIASFLDVESGAGLRLIRNGLFGPALPACVCLAASPVSAAEPEALSVSSRLGFDPIGANLGFPARTGESTTAWTASLGLFQPEASVPGDDAAGVPEGGADDHHDLAVKLQNPIANLISVPFQFNWDTGIGPDDDRDRITVNIQPVVPIKLNEDLNLISRTILPVVYAEGPSGGISSEFGVGDIVQSLFFSPTRPVGGWILGAGPALGIPTGTDDLFRSKQFSLGPTFVGLKQDKLGEGTLTYGLLTNHLWKVAGSDKTPDTNATFLQPFIGYTTGGGSSFFFNTESTYNWTSEEWSVPLNATFSQLLQFGHQPVQLQFGARYYADTVPDGPEWGLRFGITFLFPK